jgi:two-component system sensor histidine kinase EvgS
MTTAAAQVPTAASPASAATFRTTSLPATLRLGPEVLTPQERAFVAALPEVRVVIPVPAARPYETLDDNGEVGGIHPEMLHYLARAFGLRVRPVLVPGWSAALEAMQRREADLIMSIGYTVERARYLEFTLGVTPLPGALFSRTGGAAAAAASAAAATGPDLGRARFALERNFLANDYVRRQFPAASILTVETTGDALRAVAQGRADHYLGSLLAAIDWLEREPVPGIEITRLHDYGGGHYHFAVRKDWAPLAEVLNKGISTLRAQGMTPGRNGRAWTAAVASVPAGMPLTAPLALTAGELDVLTRHPVWRVGAVRGLPLLNHLEPNGVHSGIAAEVTEQVVRRLGVGLHVQGYDTVGHMLDALRRGEIDLIPFLTRTPSREQEFAFSQPYVEMPYVIVARSDAPLYWSLDSLRGRTLALAGQHPLRPVLLGRYPDIRVLDVADAREALDAVADRRADAAVEVKLFANLRINADNDDRLRTVATVEEVPAQFHFATTPAGRDLLALVDRALKDIPDGEYLRMRRRWVAVDLDPPFPWRRWQPLILTATAALLILALGTGWWLRRLAREVQERRRSEDRLRDIGATLPCVAFRHLHAPGQAPPVASWVSARAEAMLGRLPAPGQSLLASLGPGLSVADRDALAADEQRGLDSGQPLHRSMAYSHPDGSTRWLTCEAVRTDAENGLTAWTGTVVDTSQEHALQARLLEAAQSRNLMLASASHELRAPAHTLALALQALPERGLTPDQDRALRIARDTVETLSQLMGDVLDAARFDGAPLRLRPRDVRLRDLLLKLVESASASATSKGLALHHHIDPALPAHVHLDPLRLRQVVVNLLSNAFKYTPAGHVELRAVRQSGEPGQPALLAISISDTGPGIAAELQGRLFTPFATAEAGAAGNAPREGSSGLGLAISRQLAERMGGRLELHSREGKGTCATLVLPLVEAAAEAPLPAREGAILVCDDDPTSRLLLAHVLRGRGFVVEEVDRAEAALERCRRGGIAAVISDLEMPGLGGLGLLRALRALGEGPARRPALVVCSGDSADNDGSIDTRDLADARLVKPVDLPSLLHTLVALGVRAPADVAS